MKSQETLEEQWPDDDQLIPLEDDVKNDRDVKSRRRDDREPVRVGSKLSAQPRGHSRSTSCEHLPSELEHGDQRA